MLYEVITYQGNHPVQLRDAVFYPPVGIEKVIEMGASSLLGQLHIVTIAPLNATNRTRGIAAHLKDRQVTGRRNRNNFV